LAEIGPHYDSAYETVILAVNIAAPCGKLRKSGIAAAHDIHPGKGLARASIPRDHETCVKLA
jgi:hypothetical protein